MTVAERILHLGGVAIAGRPGWHDLSVEGGVIRAIAPSQKEGGGFVTPLLADVHVHIDKTYTIGRIEAGAPGKVESLFDAIDLMERDRPNWTAPDIRRRASRALEAAFRAGVGAMRSHVDWTVADVPDAWPVLVELREEWKGRIELQLAALVRGDIVPEAGEAIAARVARDGGVLGAFFYRNPDLAQKVETMFALAARYDLDLDFHVDEGLEAEADGFSLIVDAAARHGMAGRVLCGHACSLSLRAAGDLERILARAAAAGVALVALPTTNLYLQDRAGGRSPRLRGIAPLKEARAAGMAVMLASDNVGDAFYPYGDYDPLSVWRLALPAVHLDPADWLDSVTTLSARWCGAKAETITPGAAANFILHAARDAGDLASRPQAKRTVYRDGKALAASDHDWRHP